MATTEHTSTALDSVTIPEFLPRIRQFMTDLATQIEMPPPSTPSSARPLGGTALEFAASVTGERYSWSARQTSAWTALLMDRYQIKIAEMRDFALWFLRQTEPQPHETLSAESPAESDDDSSSLPSSRRARRLATASVLAAVPVAAALPAAAAPPAPALMTSVQPSASSTSSASTPPVPGALSQPAPATTLSRRTSLRRSGADNTPDDEAGWDSQSGGDSVARPRSRRARGMATQPALARRGVADSGKAAALDQSADETAESAAVEPKRFLPFTPKGLGKTAWLGNLSAFSLVSGLSIGGAQAAGPAGGPIAGSGAAPPGIFGSNFGGGFDPSQTGSFGGNLTAPGSLVSPRTPLRLINADPTPPMTLANPSVGIGPGARLAPGIPATTAHFVPQSVISEIPSAPRLGMAVSHQSRTQTEIPLPSAGSVPSAIPTLPSGQPQSDAGLAASFGRQSPTASGIFNPRNLNAAKAAVGLASVAALALPAVSASAAAPGSGMAHGPATALPTPHAPVSAAWAASVAAMGTAVQPSASPMSLSGMAAGSAALAVANRFLPGHSPGNVGAPAAPLASGVGLPSIGASLAARRMVLSGQMPVTGANPAPGLPGVRSAVVPPRMAVGPELGQLTLVAPPLRVASAQAEQAGVAAEMDWQTLAGGATPLDEGGLARLKQALPATARVLYPAIPANQLSGGAVNLRLSAPLAQTLLRSGYGSQAAQTAVQATSLAASAGGMLSSKPLAARLVPGKRPVGNAAGLLGQPAETQGGAGALRAAGSGQAARGGPMNFLGLPVSLAPSLSGSAHLARETALREGKTPAGGASTIRPENFAPLRNRLFPAFQSMAVEPDRRAWSKAAPSFGLRDSHPATILSPDARAVLPTATSPVSQQRPISRNAPRPFGLPPSLAAPLLASMGQTANGAPPTSLLRPHSSAAAFLSGRNVGSPAFAALPGIGSPRSAAGASTPTPGLSAPQSFSAHGISASPGNRFAGPAWSGVGGLSSGLHSGHPSHVQKAVGFDAPGIGSVLPSRRAGAFTSPGHFQTPPFRPAVGLASGPAMSVSDSVGSGSLGSRGMFGSHHGGSLSSFLPSPGSGRLSGVLPSALSAGGGFGPAAAPSLPRFSSALPASSFARPSSSPVSVGNSSALFRSAASPFLPTGGSLPTRSLKPASPMRTPLPSISTSSFGSPSPLYATPSFGRLPGYPARSAIPSSFAPSPGLSPAPRSRGLSSPPSSRAFAPAGASLFGARSGSNDALPSISHLPSSGSSRPAVSLPAHRHAPLSTGAFAPLDLRTRRTHEVAAHDAPETGTISSPLMASGHVPVPALRASVPNVGRATTVVLPGAFPARPRTASVQAPNMIFAPPRALRRTSAAPSTLAIQRAVTTSSGASMVSSPTPAMRMPERAAHSGGSNGMAANQVNMLASEVWSLLKRRLSIEAERRGRW